MNRCSLKVCKREAKVWLQMDKLGTVAGYDTPCIWLCEFHAKKVRNWGFKE